MRARVTVISSIAAVYIAAVLGLTHTGLMYSNPWIAVLPIVVSPVAMWLIRIGAEHNKPRGMFNPRTQAWSFLFGDIIALPVAFYAMAMGRRQLTGDGFWAHSWWHFVAFACGITIATVWSRSEQAAYRKINEEDRAFSPSKIWHDHIVYWYMSTYLIFGGVPVLVAQPLGWGAVALGAVLVWAVIGIADVIRKPAPAAMHPRVQDTRVMS